MKYFAAGGWWLPDREAHLQDWMTRVNKRVVGPGGEERLAYQYHKYEKLLPWAKQRRIAVDVGAHVGLWSWVLARDFEEVVAFEPVPGHYLCWMKNMQQACKNAWLWPHALGETSGNVILRTRTADSSGDTGVEPGAPEPGNSLFPLDPGYFSAELQTLDSFDLVHVDLMKLDCEGYELFALKGAVETLKRCRPAIIVEQKPETGFEARYGVTAKDCIAFLTGLGAVQRQVIQGDYIFSWD